MQEHKLINEVSSWPTGSHISQTGKKVKPTTGSYWYPLFEHMAREHGLILLDGECYEIALIVNQLKKEPK